ncbi:NUDIX hydrolase [Thermacetogenium phaeum]|jgi:8-oxo-dGTP pyrophosphatase MutT (NUDIX family)|nr:CoA pyrophosphatase [Thermacetogenium phaeum]
MTGEQLMQLQHRLSDRPGLLGREDHLNTAVLMLLMPVDGEYHFVLEERQLEIPQGGEICFPGGAFDPEQDADTVQTAIRETVEELGIAKERLELLGALGTLYTSMGAIVDAYVGVCRLRGLDELRINTSEVKSAFTIPVSRFENTSPEEYRALVRVHPTYTEENTGQVRILFPSAELGLPKRYSRPWGSRTHRILVYRMGPRIVWGVTARLIYELLRRMR